MDDNGNDLSDENHERSQLMKDSTKFGEEFVGVNSGNRSSRKKKVNKLIGLEGKESVGSGNASSIVRVPMLDGPTTKEAYSKVT